MSDRSPLFINAAELLIHAVELFRQVNERKYRFIILHLASAVELILQDRLIDAGESVYESGKPVAINIGKALEALKKLHVKIPERPVIELLSEDRETIHHRLGAPELKTVYYYIDTVAAFFKRFLREEYGVELSDVLNELELPESDLQLLGILEGQRNEIAFLEKLFELSPDSAILQAFKFVEGKFGELFFIQQGYLELKIRKPFLLTSQKNPDFERLLEGLIEARFLPRKLINKLDLLRKARNFAVYHNIANGAEQPAWAEALEVAKGVITGLNRAIEAGYTIESAAHFPEDLEKEHDIWGRDKDGEQ
jgi:hypothetical protein